MSKSRLVLSQNLRIVLITNAKYKESESVYSTIAYRQSVPPLFHPNK